MEIPINIYLLVAIRVRDARCEEALLGRLCRRNSLDQELPRVDPWGSGGSILAEGEWVSPLQLNMTRSLLNVCSLGKSSTSQQYENGEP